jgi:hypothetical protein
MVMTEQEQIDQQKTLLETHRRTLRYVLIEQAKLGSGYVPPQIRHSIYEARAAIRHCKAALHAWGVAVEDHPDDEEASPPSSASASQQAGAMLNVVADLASVPAVRMKVASFKDSFQIVCQQIARLAVDKDLHDRLHDLQFKCYNPIANGARDFPANPSFLENLEQYQADLQEIVNILYDIAERAGLAAIEQAWIKQVDQAAALLGNAIDRSDKKQLEHAAFEIGRVIYVNQPQINTRLKETARELPLASLRDAITAVQPQLASLDVSPDKLRQIDQGIIALEQLGQSLAKLIEEHDVWQRIDLDLHLIENNLEQQLDQLGWMWPDLQAKIGVLCGSRSDRWTESLRQAAAKLEEALARQTSSGIITAFRPFRSQAAKCFYQADKQLKELCESLRRVDGPLNSVLSIVERTI